MFLLKLNGDIDMKKEWIIVKDKNNSSKSLIERLLAKRGITKPNEVKEFLNPLETKLTHPNAFIDMQKAVARISKAINEKEKILIYGDFDADGVTSTALLYRTFKELNAEVDYFIPDRDKHGHGLNSKELVKLMASKKPKLIITCDCASSDIEQVNFLNSFKIDIIITDHHEAPEELPAAYAIINPKAQNALDEKLSAKEIEYLTLLAGVGVAFKLAQALLDNYKKLDFIYEILHYVTVGTISDVVPLIGENRYFVTKGLQLISEGKHLGLKRLLESAGYVLAQGITSEQIAFGVAPRINASGRLDTTEEALKVLISDNKQEIEMAIISLNNFNKIRQELCESTFLEAEEGVNRELDKNAIILFKPDWHIGIIGIVASKLVEKYYKPTFLMTYSEETKQVRCSSRSIEGVNIYDVLSANAEMFDGFGGHAMACGLSFDTEKVTFEEVKKALNTTIDELLGDKKLTPFLNIDLQLEPNEVDGNLIADIERLQPFGASNPNPVFALNNLTLLQKKLIGSNKNHLKLVVEDSQHNTFDCIWWSKGDISLNRGDTLDIAFCPQTNTYNGNTTIQLIIQDIHADNLKEDEEPQNVSNAKEIRVYDHRKKVDIYSSVDDYVKTSDLSIGVFAEDKSIIDRLKPYNSLSDRLIDRQTDKKIDAIMFFDYPASKEIFDKILDTTKARFVHFMNYKNNLTDEKELLKTFLGMIKFAFNNKEGVFNLQRSAAFLAQTEDTIISLLEAFEASKIISGNKSGENYQIKTFENNDISKILHTEEYKDFTYQINKVCEFKNSILNAELNQII